MGNESPDSVWYEVFPHTNCNSCNCCIQKRIKDSHTQSPNHAIQHRHYAIPVQYPDKLLPRSCVTSNNGKIDFQLKVFFKLIKFSSQHLDSVKEANKTLIGNNHTHTLANTGKHTDQEEVLPAVLGGAFKEDQPL